MSSSSPNRAISWLIVNWVTVALAEIAFLVRIYTRAFVTRSMGSDDFSLAISALLTITGTIINSAQFHYGLGRHQADLSSHQYTQEQKLEYVAWIIVYINYFFLRGSVLLFVLRLLPPYKKLHQRIIYVEFFVSFAITLVTTTTYGLGCIPFKALYTNVPGAKCFSKEKLVIVARVNGILSCCIDITTSFVPVFLLWGVQMKPSTKRVLNVIFCFGIITAATSIGRAATSTTRNLSTDTTWRSLPSKWFGMTEDNFGVIFACAPAMRQLYRYRRRTGAFLPGRDRQSPNEDFRKMRRRVNLRDIFWYRQALLKDGKVSDAHPIFQYQSDKDIERPIAPERLPSDAPPPTQNSVMDWWEDRIKKIFFRSPTSQSSNADASDEDPLKPASHNRSLSRQERAGHTTKSSSSSGPTFVDVSTNGSIAFDSRNETWP